MITSAAESTSDGEKRFSSGDHKLALYIHSRYDFITLLFVEWQKEMEIIIIMYLHYYTYAPNTLGSEVLGLYSVRSPWTTLCLDSQFFHGHCTQSNLFLYLYVIERMRTNNSRYWIVTLTFTISSLKLIKIWNITVYAARKIRVQPGPFVAGWIL